jgi:hypothetical protein
MRPSLPKEKGDEVKIVSPGLRDARPDYMFPTAVIDSGPTPWICMTVSVLVIA